MLLSNFELSRLLLFFLPPPILSWLWILRPTPHLHLHLLPTGASFPCWVIPYFRFSSLFVFTLPIYQYHVAPGHPSYIPLTAPMIPVSMISPATISPSSSNESNTSFTPPPTIQGEQITLDPTSMMQQLVAFQPTGAYVALQYGTCMIYYSKKNLSMYVSCTTSRHLCLELTNVFQRFEGPQAVERPLS